MSETAFGKTMRLALGRDRSLALLRNNVGLFRTLTGNRRVRCGLVKGSGDYIGWKSIIITQAMVGMRIAVFLSIETKAKRGRLSKFQKIWMTNVRKAGGYAGVARTVEEAVRITNGEIIE